MSGPSRAEVKALLTSLLPAGSEQLYDLSESAYIGGTLSGLAGALKDTLTDRIAVLRNEVNPSTVAELLPEWEQATGLAYTPIALFGTIEQRRNAVLAALRMSGGSFSLDEIRSIVQPYFLYADPSQIAILEPDRGAQRTAHTYINGTPVTVAMGVAGLSAVTVPDDPRVSQAGASAVITLTTTRLDQLSLVIQGPDGFQAVFPAGWLARDATSATFEAFRLFAPGFARKGIRGTWSLGFVNAAASTTLHTWGLFVEGEGAIFGPGVPPPRLGEGKGAVVFEFAVVADLTKLGTGYDLVGAARAITRWKPAHVNGFIAVTTPMGSICAIPDTDNAIPDFAIPC